MKIAGALIVKNSNKEIPFLEKCLESISKIVDSLFITITDRQENADKDVLNTISRYTNHISFFEWINDFSAARNYNFSQVPQEYDYILWADADDVFRGGEKIREILEKNPQVDGLSLYYYYSFDENKNPIGVHLKTQVIKNDGCATWKGKLHEDLIPNRKVNIMFLKGVERIHLSTPDRINEAKGRNIEISKKQTEEEPEDPRSWWNYGNSLLADNRNEEAIIVFNKFLEMSKSDEEKYLATIRKGEALWRVGKKNEAIDSLRYAIGLKPEYPDAYHFLGGLFFEMKEYEKARDMYLLGLAKPIPYYSIIVFNPRDYDYNPLKKLASVYFAMGFPQLALPCLEACLKIHKDEKTKKLVSSLRRAAKKEEKILKIVKSLRKINDKEKLKNKIQKLPIDFQSHPAVCHIKNINFIKETSSGKDIVIFCGHTAELWTPATAKRNGVGGSEEAVIWLAKLLKERGWNVFVYNNCGHKEVVFDGVVYRPFWSWNYRDKQDVVILWRSPMMLDYDINANKIFVDLHDVISPAEFTPKRIEKLTKVFVKSHFHRSLFPNIPDDKIVVVPNGIDDRVFSLSFERDNNLLINTSSPDRGLNVLCDLFERVKKEVPGAKLKWAYGWNVWDNVYSSDIEKMKWKDNLIKKMERLEIENLGRISHEEVAKLYLQANVFAYPSEFAEIDCISLTKAMAGGAIPVTTDFSAMGEKQGHGGYFIHSEKTKDNWCMSGQYDFSIADEKMKDEWVEKVVFLLKNPPTEEQREEMRKWARETFSWNRIVDVWEEEIKK